jgi:hypothetical protein
MDRRDIGDTLYGWDLCWRNDRLPGFKDHVPIYFIVLLGYKMGVTEVEN